MRFLFSVALVLLLASFARADDFVLGYNQGWLEGKFARDLSGEFDEATWRKLLVRTREGGGSVLRVWLFEGQPMEGVVWDYHRPAGVEPAFLENVRRLSALAASEHVQLYWTGFDGNWFGPTTGMEFARRYNIYNDKYGYGTAFRENVLGPVLDVIRERPDTIYAFDLLNEAEGALHVGSWPDMWDGARRFMESWSRFVHARAPGVRVTSSAGWSSAQKDVVKGHFDGVGLDFFDVHVYTNDTHVPRGEDLAAHARSQGLPIIVGELGQKAKRTDDQLQAEVVRGVIEDAKRLGFAGVLVWRLVDEQEHDRRLSFWSGDQPRPAVQVMKDLASRRGLTGSLR